MDNSDGKVLVDFNRGTTNKVDLKHTVKKVFNNDTLIRSNDRYSNFDYTNNTNLLIELETRNKCEDTKNMIK